MSWKCKFVLQRELKAYAVMYLLEPLYQNFCLYSRKDTECVNGTICWCLMIRNRTNEVTLSWSSLIMLYVLVSFNHQLFGIITKLISFESDLKCQLIDSIKPSSHISRKRQQCLESCWNRWRHSCAPLLTVWTRKGNWMYLRIEYFLSNLFLLCLSLAVVVWWRFFSFLLYNHEPI